MCIKLFEKQNPTLYKKLNDSSQIQFCKNSKFKNKQTNKGIDKGIDLVLTW